MPEKEKAEPTTLAVPKDVTKLPDQPWSLASLKERYGEDGGEEMYCRVAEKGGYFDARSDRGYRPDLHP